MIPSRRFRCAQPQNDVVTDSVGFGIHILRRLRSASAVMDAHATQIGTEMGLPLGAIDWGQRSPRFPQRLSHGGWSTLGGRRAKTAERAS